MAQGNEFQGSHGGSNSGGSGAAATRRGNESRGSNEQQQQGGGVNRAISNGREAVAEFGQHAQEEATQFLQSNPMLSVMTGFGLGLGFGLAISLLLSRREPSWYERAFPEQFQHLPESLKRVPQSIGSYLPNWK